MDWLIQIKLDSFYVSDFTLIDEMVEDEINLIFDQIQSFFITLLRLINFNYYLTNINFIYFHLRYLIIHFNYFIFIMVVYLYYFNYPNFIILILMIILIMKDFDFSYHYYHLILLTMLYFFLIDSILLKILVSNSLNIQASNSLISNLVF